MIVPFGEATSGRVKVADLAAFGMWADRADMADPVAYVDEIRKPRRF